MFARLLALVCLLQFGLCIGRSEPVLPPAHPLVVYLTGKQSTSAVDAMKSEVDELMGTAGYTVEWRGVEEASQVTDAPLVVMELRGTCVPPQNLGRVEPLTSSESLASTAVENGRVLPFSWVNCDTLTRMLASSLNKKDREIRTHMYGRAMGRIVAHELYHILANERDHASAGVTKPCFTTSDVLAEQFNFDNATLAKLRPQPHPIEEGGEGNGDAAAFR